MNVRLDALDHAALNRQASANLRSANAQIVWLIRHGDATTATVPISRGTDELIETIIGKLDGEDVPLRGQEWRATSDSYGPALMLTQWADSSERDVPTGPKVRVTFTVNVEEIPRVEL